MSKHLLTHILPKVRLTSKIGYEVLFVNEFPNDPKCLGECRYDSKQIVIKNDESNTETLKTYIHEILHAVSNEYGANLTETQVGKMENGIYNFFRLNGYLKK